MRNELTSMVGCTIEKAIQIDQHNEQISKMEIHTDDSMPKERLVVKDTS